MHFKSNSVEECGLFAEFYNSYLLQRKSCLPLNLRVMLHSQLSGIYFSIHDKVSIFGTYLISSCYQIIRLTEKQKTNKKKRPLTLSEIIPWPLPNPSCGKQKQLSGL